MSKQASNPAKDTNGRDLNIGDRILTYHPDTREQIAATIENIDSRQDKPGDPIVIVYTTPDGESKWEYADSVERI